LTRPRSQSAPPERLGPYQLLRPIGGGGTGELFLAMRPGLSVYSRYLVVKRLRRELARDPEHLAAILDATRLLATLHHPNIVRVYDSGEATDAHYLAMEYVSGRDLRAVLDALGGPLDVAVAVHVIDRLCDGVQHAHGAAGEEGDPLGLVHAALCPEHVLVDFSGAVKLCSFSGTPTLARRRRAPELAGRLAPEQLAGDSVDQRSDVFGLGQLLFELTTGAPPSDASGQPRSPRDVVPGYPTDLAEICGRAAEADPDRRYPTVAALQEDLLRFRQRSPVVGASRLSQVMKRHFTADLHTEGIRTDSGRRSPPPPADDDAPTQVRRSGEIPGWTDEAPPPGPLSPNTDDEADTIVEAERDHDERDATLVGHVVSAPLLDDGPPPAEPPSEEAEYRKRAWAKLERQLMTGLETRRSRRPTLAVLLLVLAIVALGALLLLRLQRPRPPRSVAAVPAVPAVPAEAGGDAPSASTPIAMPLVDAGASDAPPVHAAPNTPRGPVDAGRPAPRVPDQQASGGGRLRMAVTPPVTVFLAERELGRTPFLVDVPSGTLHLRLENRAEGILLWRAVRVQPGDLTVFRWTLGKGKLKVDSPTPVGVTVDGVDRGTAPIELELYEGRHVVRLTDVNGKARTRRVKVPAGGAITIQHKPTTE